MIDLRKATIITVIFLVLINVGSHINYKRTYAKGVLNNAIQNILVSKVNQLQQNQLQLCRSGVATLSALLSLACTNAQSNTTIRAQCMGCFSAATSNILTPTLLTSLLPCAMLYLNDTNYGTCITTLQTAISTTTQVNTTTNCPTGYCTFVQCIRRIHANSLVDMCYMNSLPGNNIATSAGRTSHYLLITSCILAMSRCNTVNPISGVPQNNASRSYNSLQVTRNGDLRIITVSRTAEQMATGFCLSDTSLEQSGWGTIMCN